MRVSVVHVPYQVRGGEEHYVDSLLAAYADAGVAATLWPISNSGINASSALRALTTGQTAAWNATADSQKPDILHLNNVHPSLGPSFLRWARARALPAIATIHNHRFYCTNGLALYGGTSCKACKGSLPSWRPLLFNCNGNFVKSAYHSLALPGMQGELPALAALVAPTGYMARELAESTLGLPAARVIPHPVVASSARAEKPLYDCIYAGRFSEEKGLRRLIALARNQPGRIFAFAGSGPLESELAGLALPNVRILGSLSKARLHEAIAASRAACVPSFCEESFSLFGLESLLLGTPVVTAPKESLRWLTELPFPALRAEGESEAEIISALSAKLDLAWQSPAPAPAALASMAQDFSLRRHGETLRSLLAEKLAAAPR